MSFSPASLPDGRKLLLDCYWHALGAVNGRTAVARALAEEDDPGRQGWRIVAIGKAASAMALGAFDVLGAAVESALVVSRDGHFDAALQRRADVNCMTAAHPVPDERSLAAGQELLRAVKACPPDRRLLFLVSGGASSLAEVPAPGVTLNLLREWNRWAQANGLEIQAINAVRTRLSAIKGGRLLAHAHADALALFISDVPGDDPSLIGSGLLGGGGAYPLPRNLPPWIEPLVRENSGGPQKITALVRRRVVATLDDALTAAERFGEASGVRVQCHRGRFTAPVLELATRMCHEMILGAGQLHVWGGEGTVVLPQSPGRGGRCQHLALAAARLLEGHPGLCLLAAGSDGTDGSSDDAGALVDDQTIEKGTLEGLDVDDCLVRADSGTFLEASGDLLHTGPTGTNVGDLVLGYAPG